MKLIKKSVDGHDLSDYVAYLDARRAAFPANALAFAAASWHYRPVDAVRMAAGPDGMDFPRLRRCLVFAGLLMRIKMSDFGEFLLRLGYLHDCTVTRFEWKPDQKSMAFEIEDLYFNFEGLPEYKGPTPGRIVLEGIQHVSIEIREFEGPLRVYEFSLVKERADTADVSVSFSPSGKISVVYQRATFPVIPLP